MKDDTTSQVDWHERFCQQAAWTRELRTYLYKSAGLSGDSKVLEVGCGTGALLMEFSKPAIGTLHGLDLDASRLKQAHLNAPRAILTCADGHDLPFPSITFDITCCHYLLMWVRDPAAVLRQMARVTRPGGGVLVMAEPDYGGRIDHPKELACLGRWQAEALRRQGADPGIGSRLDALFLAAGIHLREAGRMSEGYQHPLTPREQAIEWAVLEADLAGTIPPNRLGGLKQLDDQAWRDGTRRLFIPTHFAWGRV